MLLLCQKMEDTRYLFDNYLTSVNLIRYLDPLKICASGAILENRVGNRPLKTKLWMKKEQRGAYDFKICDNT